MVTTIQISEKLKKKLELRKSVKKESYEDVIWDLLEDTGELSEQTKKDLYEARKEVEEGKVKTLEEVKKELGL
ncbi:MAG TPA: hypothetical protein VJG83_05590 [archaeon]|nr:hypothetical protein [archaeon]